MSDLIGSIIEWQRAEDDAREFRREFIERLHTAKHEFMATHLRESGIVPELLTCDDCGEALAPWPEPA